MTDPLRLGQIVANLPGDATRFTSEGVADVRTASLALGGTRRVDANALVIGDGPRDTQRELSTVLTRLGLVVEGAADGAEALDRREARPFDLVCSECRMPVLGGEEATRRLRERERCPAAGMDDVLAKPVQLEELSSTLERWLGGCVAASA